MTEPREETPRVLPEPEFETRVDTASKIKSVFGVSEEQFVSAVEWLEKHRPSILSTLSRYVSFAFVMFCGGYV